MYLRIIDGVIDEFLDEFDAPDTTQQLRYYWEAWHTPYVGSVRTFESDWF
jgi:hypothetical protein